MSRPAGGAGLELTLKKRPSRESTATNAGLPSLARDWAKNDRTSKALLFGLAFLLDYSRSPLRCVFAVLVSFGAGHLFRLAPRRLDIGTEGAQEHRHH